MSWLKEANLPLDGWFYVYQDFSRITSAPGWYRREVGEWELDPDNKDLMRQTIWELHFPAYGSTSIKSLQEKRGFYRKDVPIEPDYPWGDGGGYRDSSRKWN